MYEMQNTPGPDATYAALPNEQISLLGKKDFNPQEMVRLIEARGRFVHGELHEWTSEYKWLLFARWLYEHGRIDEGQSVGACMQEKMS